MEPRHLNVGVFDMGNDISIRLDEDQSRYMAALMI